MKIYLDTCSLQRPLDSKTQIRISWEAEAILGILGMVEMGEIELISSEILQFEVRRNPNPIRQAHAIEVLAQAKTYVELDDNLEQQAKIYQKSGIKPLDALHLAASTAVKADYFCTCDDQFLKRAKQIPDLQTKVVSPMELVEELEQW